MQYAPILCVHGHVHVLNVIEHVRLTTIRHALQINNSPAHTTQPHRRIISRQSGAYLGTQVGDDRVRR